MSAQIIKRICISIVLFVVYILPNVYSDPIKKIVINKNEKNWKHVDFPESDQGIVESVAFSEDGRVLATGSANGRLTLHHPEDGQKTFDSLTNKNFETHQFGLISDIAFSNGRVLFFSAYKKNRQLYSIPRKSPSNIQKQELNEIHRKPWGKLDGFFNGYLFPEQSDVWYLRYAPEEKKIYLSSDRINFSGRESGHKNRKTPVPDYASSLIPEIGFSDDASLVAFSGGWPRRLILHRTDTGKRIHTFVPPDKDYASSFAFVDEGKRLISAHSFGDVFEWDITTGKRNLLMEITRENHHLYTLAVSRDHSLLVHHIFDGKQQEYYWILRSRLQNKTLFRFPNISDPFQAGVMRRNKKITFSPFATYFAQAQGSKVFLGQTDPASWNGNDQLLSRLRELDTRNLFSKLHHQKPEVGYTAEWILSERQDKVLEVLEQKIPELLTVTSARFKKHTNTIRENSPVKKEHQEWLVHTVGTYHRLQSLKKSLKEESLKEDVDAILDQKQELPLQRERLTLARSIRLLGRIRTPRARQLLEKIKKKTGDIWSHAMCLRVLEAIRRAGQKKRR